jgi:hypothetical protein
MPKTLSKPLKAKEKQSVKHLQGSEEHSPGFQGSGEHTLGLQGSGEHTLGLQGSGEHTLGLQGSGEHTLGLQGSGEHIWISALHLSDHMTIHLCCLKQTKT